MKKILIADDNETNLKILNIILNKAGYDVLALNDSTKVLQSAKDYKPDLILSDVNMPDIDGFELCQILKNDDEVKEIPVIFITALSDSENIVHGFSQGAVDYITKPYRAEEVKMRVSTHLKIRELQEQLEEHNRNLSAIVEAQIKQISDMQMATIFSLAKLAQSRDDDTGSHIERVQKYCYLLATTLQKKGMFKDEVNDNFIKNISNAAPMHDIGKVGISDLILLKPGKLTPEEYEIMKTHTVIGANTLHEVNEKYGGNAFIQMGEVVARFHHERWDGNGYPDKLEGENIPLAARIMAIADVYDALSTKRVYKDAYTKDKCVQIIKEGAGTQFDPVLVDVFLEISEEFWKVYECLND